MQENLTFYLGHPDYVEDLKSELALSNDQEIVKNLGEGYLCRGPAKKMIFAQNTWHQCITTPISSISEGQKLLKSVGKNWVSYKHQFSRRMSLIEEKIHRYTPPKIQFPNNYTLLTPNAWTLLAENELLYSLNTDSQYPLGLWQLAEDKNAPSRAYTKLWETFLRLGVWPKPGEFCLDMGSCPGGWTYVLNNLGAKTLSVDRSPLTENLLKSPLVENKLMDAFKLDPNSVAALDWFFSDLICYPDKLLELVTRWLQVHPSANYVCTIKFQGETDFSALRKFLEIPGSEIFHLNANKHEVTWVRLKK